MTITTLTFPALAVLVGAPASDNLKSVMSGLATGGRGAGLDAPHRLVPFLAQVSHESMGFRYDREVWGPTPAQKRYDTRTDLGNTPERDGDGKKFMGHTAMQITGRSNTCDFRDWCRRRFPVVPDFEIEPELMNTDPWEGLGPIWYWDTRELNTWADTGDFANVTRKINGGLNGYADRCERFSRIALRMLGYEATGIARFQKDVGLKADGIAGPKTRRALHERLKQLPPVSFLSPVEPRPVAPLAPTPSKPIPAQAKPEPTGFLHWLMTLLKGSR